MLTIGDVLAFAGAASFGCLVLAIWYVSMLNARFVSFLRNKMAELAMQKRAKDAERLKEYVQAAVNVQRKILKILYITIPLLAAFLLNVVLLLFIRSVLLLSGIGVITLAMLVLLLLVVKRFRELVKIRDSAVAIIEQEVS